jgi:hypothetical protein
MIGEICAKRTRGRREEGREEEGEERDESKRNDFCDCVECESFPLMDA